MKYFIILLVLISLSSLIIPNVSAVCIEGAMEWWEPCNDAGQNDVFSFKATALVIFVLVILAISIIFFVVKKWRKRK